MSEQLSGAWARRPDVRIGAVVAVAIAVAFVVWLLGRGNDSNTASTVRAQTVQAIAPVAVSRARLRALSVDVGRPIYWVGPRAGNTYELTRTSQDRIYVRYLPPGVPTGTRKASYTIVGTYPVADAHGVLAKLARKSGESSFSAPNRGLAVYSTSRPTNVYLAYPGTNVQIEVFDPLPRRARALIRFGQVTPIQ